MTLEIQVLAWNRHNKCGGANPVNGISTLPSWWLSPVKSANEIHNTEVFVSIYSWTICIMFKIIAFFTTTLFAQLYESCNFTHMWTVFTWRHPFTKRGSLYNNTSLSRHLLLKCLYKARNVSCHVFVCKRYQFCLFLRFFY